MPSDSRFRGNPLACRAAFLHPGVYRHSHESGNPLACRAAFLSLGAKQSFRRRRDLPISSSLWNCFDQQILRKNGAYFRIAGIGGAQVNVIYVIC
jgi:hypothetical protein